MGGSVGLIVGSSNGGYDCDFFMHKPFSLHGLSSLSLILTISSSLCLSQQLLPLHSLSHISLVQSLHWCWVLDFGGWISVDRQAGFGSMGWDRLMVGLDWLIGGFEMVDLLIGGWIS